MAKNKAETKKNIKEGKVENPNSSKLREYVEALLTALILALVIRAYVVGAYKIPSGSMKPTLLVGDYILVNKFIYGTKIPFTDKTVFPLKEPQRGDIVVFKYPKDPSRDFIKRVIAVEGEKLLIKGNHIYINEELIDDPWGDYSNKDINSPIEGKFTGPMIIPKNKYFVMGDNRDKSYDSRFWGFVSESDIRGEAFIIYFSWESIWNIRWERIGKALF